MTTFLNYFDLVWRILTEGWRETAFVMLAASLLYFKDRASVIIRSIVSLPAFSHVPSLRRLGQGKLPFGKSDNFDVLFDALPGFPNQQRTQLGSFIGSIFREARKMVETKQINSMPELIVLDRQFTVTGVDVKTKDILTFKILKGGGVHAVPVYQFGGSLVEEGQYQFECSYRDRHSRDWRNANITSQAVTERFIEKDDVIEVKFSDFWKGAMFINADMLFFPHAIYYGSIGTLNGSIIFVGDAPHNARVLKVDMRSRRVTTFETSFLTSRNKKIGGTSAKEYSFMLGSIKPDDVVIFSYWR